MTSNLLVLVSFSTLYSSSLWRTNSIVFSKLNKLLPLKGTTAPQMGVGGGGLIEDLQYMKKFSSSLVVDPACSGFFLSWRLLFMKSFALIVSRVVGLFTPP